MKFWDAFNEFITGKQSSQDSEVNADIWRNLETNTRNSQSESDGDIFNGISNMSARIPTRPQSNPYDQDPHLTQSIIQENKQGFRVYDINSFTLDSDNYKCTIPDTQLFEIFGYDPKSEIDLTGGGIGILSSWRTVPIQATGTFLKVEILPPRSAYTDFFATDPNLSASMFDKLLLTENYFPDQTIIPPISNVLFVQGPDRQLSNSILIQFESSTAPVHVAKHGEIYKLPFNTIYLSVRQRGTRFRLTVGYNSEIQNTDTKGFENMNLAFGTGGGIWSNPTRMPVPFSTSSKIHDTGATGPLLTAPRHIAAYTSIGATGISTQSVVDQSQTLTSTNPAGTYKPVKNGVGVMWLTSFNIMFGSNIVGLNLYRVTIFKNTTSTGAKQKLYYQDCIVQNITSGNTQSNIYPHANIDFAHPIRVVLAPTESLVVTVTAQVGNTGAAITDAYYEWTLKGYVLGGFAGLGNKSANGTWFRGYGQVANYSSTANAYWCYTLLENPFVEDYPYDTLLDGT